MAASYRRPALRVRVRPATAHDLVLVQDKLDGSNCVVAKIESKVMVLTRGYLAASFPFEQHY